MSQINIPDPLRIIKRGATEIIGEAELVARLEKAAKVGPCLRIKAGFDPTAPDLHLGHTVLLRKLRQFQDLGHTVIFLIGDATALVGDPSGQSKTRKTMTWDEVEANTKTYVKQVGKILKTDVKRYFELRRNSEWFSRGKFAFEQFVDLAQRYTVARLLERDDFKKRLEENKPISFLELFYPLMQGYDSVMLKSDVEIGGSDQKFNLLVGRELQRAYGQEPQIVLTMPLLEGTDGVNKMSKSLGNYIGINEPAKEIFGKVMKVSDPLMARYYELLTDEDMDAVKQMHPMEAKKNLGYLIAAQYCGEKAAETARGEFENVHSNNELPDIVPEHFVDYDSTSLPTSSNIMIMAVKEGKIKLPSGKASRNEVLRQFEQGAVKIDGVKVTDPNIPMEFGVKRLFQVARRVFCYLVPRKKS
jgi:tyrosyl-tRNA synthetase